MSKILIEDFKSIHNISQIKWGKFKNNTFLITGANGFIATYLINFLIDLNTRHLLRIKIILTAKDEKKLKKNFINKETKKFITLIKQDVNEDFLINKKIDHIVHLASNASPSLYYKQPIETILPNIIGTNNLLKLASKKKIKSFIFFSSGEIYGKYNGPLTEDIIHKNNHLDLRSVYGESKKMGETLCYSYFKEKKIPIKIIRLFHTYGPYMNLKDGRVMMSFVNDIINKKPISIKSDGKQKRSFCYISDVIKGFFIVLTKGQNGEAYNIGNPKETISIKKLGNFLSKINNISSVKFTNKLNNSNINNNSQSVRPSIKKISKLGFNPNVNIHNGFIRTIQHFTFIKKSR